MKQGYLQIWNQEFFKPFLFYFVQELWFDSLRHVGDKTFISATFAWHSQHLHAFGWLVGPSQSRLLHNLTIFTFCTRFWCSSLLKIFFSLLSSCPRRKYVARYDIFYFELQLITFCLEVQYLCFRKWIYWSLFVQRYNQFIISLGLSDMLNAVLMLTSHQVCLQQNCTIQCNFGSGTGSQGKDDTLPQFWSRSKYDDPPQSTFCQLCQPRNHL